MHTDKSDPLIVRRYAHSAAAVAALTVLAAWDVPHVYELWTEELPSTKFLLMGWIAMVGAGATLALSARARGRLWQFIDRQTRSAAIIHAHCAGAILGLALGACLIARRPDDAMAFARMLVVFGYALLLSLAPLWGWESLASIASRYKGLTFRRNPSRAIAFLVRLAVFATSAVGLVQWMMGG